MAAERSQAISLSGFGTVALVLALLSVYVVLVCFVSLRPLTALLLRKHRSRFTLNRQCAHLQRNTSPRVCIVGISDTVLLQIRSRSNEKPVVPVASFSYTRIGQGYFDRPRPDMNVGVLINDEGAGTEATKRPSIFGTLLSTLNPQKAADLAPDLCRAPAEVDDIDTIFSVRRTSNKTKATSKRGSANLTRFEIDETTFAEIAELIAASRERALQSVNTVLIELYWRVGEIISRKIESAEWGDGTVDRLSLYVAKRQPGIRGFSRANLFRMRQFYET